MKKILEKNIAEFKGRLYEMKGGYGYKIFYRGKIVDRSYAVYFNKIECMDSMNHALLNFTHFNKDLFDLDKL